MDDAITRGYADAAGFFCRTVGAVGPDRWDGPGLDQWSMRSLVGHGARALSLVEAYLKPEGDPSPDAVMPVTPAGAATYADPAAITQRGVAAGEALGDDPAAEVERLAARALTVIAEAGPRAVSDTPFGVFALGDYLRTRIVELVTHGIDVARALGQPDPIEVPAGAMRVALGQLADNALHAGLAVPLIEALTGRRPLPDGFRAVP
jgi:uncharacterized protein (TIGR03083 family)